MIVIWLQYTDLCISYLVMIRKYLYLEESWHIEHSTSVYEKLQATRAKVAPVNLIYGTHFSATEATYKVLQNMGNL